LTIKNIGELYSTLTEELAAVLDLETRAVQLKVERSGDFPPVFIRLLAEKFNNWIISIEDLQLTDQGIDENGIAMANMSFAYNVARVPHGIEDSTIEDYRSELEELIQNVLHDIIHKTTLQMEQTTQSD